MFSSGPNYNKLKTNLRLAINRLKLLEKKKTELAQKARKEIADIIAVGKAERAKIRIEHIIREDYLVEAMEIVECYCDMLLARMGLIQQVKTLDEGLAEPISSIIWVAPRMQADVAELQVISAQLTAKYGKEYMQASRENSIGTVSPKLMHKLSIQAPPKLLVEKYLIEIAKNYNVAYEPDMSVMAEEEVASSGAQLINLDGDDDKGDNPGGGSGSGGGGGFAEPPAAEFNLPAVPSQPPPPLGFVDPTTMKPTSGTGMPHPIPGEPYDPYAVKSVPSDSEKPLNTNMNYPTPAPRSKMDDALNLPDVPTTYGLPSPGGISPNLPPPSTDEETNFDDLTKRFEALKKKK